jgi:hypothetical protein
MHPNAYPDNFFVHGEPWTNHKMAPSDSELFCGDQVLANGAQQMKDSMTHYEWQCAIADGDIGRAMNVMAVCHKSIMRARFMVG